MEDEFVVNFGQNEEFYGVYDGHGGKGAAKYVVKTLHEVFREQLAIGGDVSQAWINAYLKTDEKMMTECKDLFNSGTTAATAFVLKKNEKRMLYTANCGDTRIVIRREDGKAQRLTQDHKPADEEETKRIQKAGGSVSCNRVQGILAVSRAFGDKNFKKWGVIAEPHCAETEIYPTDTHLVVASDGLFDVMSDQDVCDALQPAADKPKSAQTLATELVQLALQKGSMDNVTVIVVDLQEEK
jgi:serine/threonine protein phosphatase PrpC